MKEDFWYVFREFGNRKYVNFQMNRGSSKGKSPGEYLPSVQLNESDKTCAELLASPAVELVCCHSSDKIWLTNKRKASVANV